MIKYFYDFLSICLIVLLYFCYEKKRANIKKTNKTVCLGRDCSSNQYYVYFTWFCER